MKTKARKTYRLSFDTLEDRLVPANFTVNTTDDFLPGTPQWAGYNRNGCSLRWAIVDMNAAGDAAGNAINIQIANGGIISLGTALQDINRKVEINGPVGQGNAVTVRRAANANANFTVFVVNNFKVTIKNLTITGGRGDEGGGIHNEGDLTLENLTITNNHAVVGNSQFGGGVFSTGSNLVIKNCTIDQNTALFGGGVFIGGGEASIENNSRISNQNRAVRGGGICIDAGTLTINGSQVSNNSAIEGGAGIAIEKTNVGGAQAPTVRIAGQVTVSDNTVDFPIGQADSHGGGIYIVESTLTILVGGTLTVHNNRASLGGGIYNEEGTVNADNGPAIITSNTARVNGGGIWNASGTMNFTRPTISNNTATGLGGGAFNSGTIGKPGTINLTTPTSRGNRARQGPGQFNDGGTNTINGGVLALNETTAPDGSGTGGAIVGINGSTITVLNSTLSGNTADTGGAIFLSGSTASLVNVTIAANDATTTGGIHLEGGASAELVNTIVAMNTDDTGSPDVSGAFTSLGHNLIGNTDGGSGFGEAGDLLNEDPMLNELGFYGGPTETMTLQAESPALDAGDDGSAPGVDQREFGRPAGEHADIGAVEMQGEDEFDNTAPVANPASFETSYQQGLNVIEAAGLKSYASDADDDPLTIIAIDGLTAMIGQAYPTPLGGTVVVQSNGSFVYTPPLNGVGEDTFTYTVSDGYKSATALVTITIPTPDIISNSVETTVNTPYVFEFLDFCFDENDDPNDFMGIRIVTGPGYGTFQLNGVDVEEDQIISAEDIEAGLLVYTPPEGQGAVPFDDFTFRLIYADGSGAESWNRHMYIDVFSGG